LPLLACLCNVRCGKHRKQRVARRVRNEIAKNAPLLTRADGICAKRVAAGCCQRRSAGIGGVTVALGGRKRNEKYRR